MAADAKPTDETTDAKLSDVQRDLRRETVRKLARGKCWQWWGYEGGGVGEGRGIERGGSVAEVTSGQVTKQQSWR